MNGSIQQWKSILSSPEAEEDRSIPGVVDDLLVLKVGDHDGQQVSRHQWTPIEEGPSPSFRIGPIVMI